MWFGPGEMKKRGWDEAAIMIKGEDFVKFWTFQEVFELVNEGICE